MAKFASVSEKLEILEKPQKPEKKIALENLVNELMKDQPSKQTVKKLTSELGMAYSIDPLTQMNTVLQSMNSVLLPSNRRKDLER